MAAALAAAGCGAQMVGPCAQRAASAPVPARAVAPPAAVALLQQRRDERSQAMADYLLAASGAAAGAEARERLQDRARSSTDPLLTVLALHMPCVRPGCRNIEASQWSRLEPANLLAWLALPARGEDGAYLLDEVAQQVRYVRSHRPEADAVLADLPPSGLALRQPWALLNLRALAAACRAPKAAQAAERCDRVAELLWAEGSAMARWIALVLGHQAQALLPQRRSVWGPRLDEVEALWRAAGPPPGQRLAEAGPSRAQVCDALEQPHTGEPATPQDWQAARGVLLAAGLPMGLLRKPSAADARRAPP